MVRCRAVVVLWLVSALTLPAEIVVALGGAPGYSWVGQTISELGTAACSPLYRWLNAALIVSGGCVVAGALWVRSLPLPERRRRSAVLTLAVVGLSTAATGAVPLDRDPELHVVVSMPALALAAVPVIVLLPRLWPERAVLRGAVSGVLLLALAAGAVVSVWLDAPWPGLLERVAVWPSTLLTSAVGVLLARRASEERDPTGTAGQRAVDPFAAGSA